MKKYTTINGKVLPTLDFILYLFDNNFDFETVIEKYGWCEYAIMISNAANKYHNNGWNVDFEITEKTWYRIGDCEYDHQSEAYKKSFNYRDNTYEYGISVIDVEWLDTLHSLFFKTDDERKIYTMTGIQIGWGSDGEPVIVPTSEIVETDLTINDVYNLVI